MDDMTMRCRNTTRRLVAGVVALGVVSAGCGGSGAPSAGGPAQGGNAALTVPAQGSGGFNYTQGSYLEGFEFTASHPISITALGAYDSNLSGLPNGRETFATVPVAVYDLTTHAQLAVLEVTAADPPSGVYHYATLSGPLALNTTDSYAVAWVSLTNYYVASPKLADDAVNAAITYVAMAGHGDGGLTQTKTMVEPDWFFTKADHGMAAVNYDLGPNFQFTGS